MSYVLFLRKINAYSTNRLYHIPKQIASANLKLYVIFNKLLKMTEKKKFLLKTIAIFAKVYYNIN